MSDYQIFNSGVLGALKTKGFVSDQENDLACDQALVSTSEWATARGINLTENWVADKFNGAQVAALQDYMEWLENWKGMPQTFTLTTVTLTLAFPVGDKGATISMSASAIIDKPEYMGRAYIELNDAIVKAYDTFRQKRPVSANSNGSGAAHSSAPSGTEILDVQDIAVEERNGKRYYKLGGGRWLKFGVTAWPEIFPAVGLEPGDFQTGRQPFPSGYKMEVELENDKPKKVRRLIAKG
jgi:hypothetical protein